MGWITGEHVRTGKLYGMRCKVLIIIPAAYKKALFTRRESFSAWTEMGRITGEHVRTENVQVQTSQRGYTPRDYVICDFNRILRHFHTHGIGSAMISPLSDCSR
ncbi:hypothetical protein Q1695_000229 [Nippostrongylus brasiliensis]|nr:hypothetical protein Q1695_000229 [Nippostrongylus brasiliensis]